MPNRRAFVGLAFGLAMAAAPLGAFAQEKLPC